MAATLKIIKFNDGTFLSVGLACPSNGDKYEGPVFNCMWDTSVSVRKTDLDGHEWVFNNRTISISGVGTYTTQSGIIAFWIDSSGNFMSYYTSELRGSSPRVTELWYQSGWLNNAQGLSSEVSDPSKYGKPLFVSANFVTGDPFYNAVVYIHNNYGNVGVVFPDACFSRGYGIGQVDLSKFSRSYAVVDPSSIPVPPPDPYENGGTSDIDGGGNGTFDDASDQIVDSTLPTISAANTGFTRIYNPTLAQVQALANYLWTDQTIIQTLWNHVKQFLENPMDAFIAFNLVPCAVPDGGTTEFKVMYIGTGVNMTAAASQFVDVDCGTLDIDEYYGSALDYAPNTKVSVFLPFIGTVQLDTDDVMGRTVGIKYRIDIVSGGCVAKILVDNSIHYQYSGHCAVNIPFTSADYTGYISAMLQAAKIGSTIASAGASAAAATAEEGVAIPEMAAAGATAAEMMEASRAYDRRIVSSGVEGAAKATFNSLAPKNISNTVGVVMSSKPVVERSGSFSGNTGYLGIRRPFCIIERPRMCNPSEYGKYNGRPSMVTLSLGDCKGFTKVQQVQLTGIPATNPELDEIGAFLKGGVIL